MFFKRLDSAVFSPPGAGILDRARVDWAFLFAVFSLMVFGTVMVYSATSPLAGSPRFPNIGPYYFLERHLVFLFVALCAAFVCGLLPMEFWRLGSRYFLWLSLGLLVLVLVPYVGHSVNGARRWISLGPVNVQICEITKFVCVLVAAQFAVTHQYYMHSFHKLCPVLAFTGVTMLLLGLQPDLGSAVVCGFIVMGMLFLANLEMRVIIPLCGAFAVAFVCGVMLSPWRLQRVMAYLNPWDPDYVMGKGYQLAHSMVAFSRGQLTGLGLGGSIEKLNYLPEAHTDFILSVVGEELGFIGVVIVLGFYYFIIRRCFEIGRRAIRLERFFAGMVAQGVGMWLGVQVIINAGVTSGVFPTKGLTLPFLSYGGSSLVMMACAVALVVRVDFENRRLMHGGR